MKRYHTHPILSRLALTAVLAAASISTLHAEPPRPKVILLDVNETLLDLAPLKKSVGEALGGREDLVPLWFSTMLHYSLVDTTTGKFHGFAEIGVAALQMVATNHGITLTKEEARAAIVPVIVNMPAHPDVLQGLKKLKAAGFTLVTLTNSSNAGIKAQLENSGLNEVVDRSLSVEDIKTYKPALASYRWALEQTGVTAGDAMLVAAHGWDIAGAEAAGLQTAFVERPGKALYPLADAPDYQVKDLNELAARLTSLPSVKSE